MKKHDWFPGTGLGGDYGGCAPWCKACQEDKIEPKPAVALDQPLFKHLLLLLMVIGKNNGNPFNRS